MSVVAGHLNKSQCWIRVARLARSPLNDAVLFVPLWKSHILVNSALIIVSVLQRAWWCYEAFMDGREYLSEEIARGGGKKIKGISGVPCATVWGLLRYLL